MIEVEHTVTIDKPVEEVFAYGADPENTPEWQDGVVSVKLDEKPPKVGTRYTETRSFMGREMETTVEVTAYEPNKRFALKAISGPVPFEAEVTLEPSGGGTQVRTKIKAEPGGFFKLAEGMVAKQLEKSMQEDDARLKAVLEGK